MKSVLVPLAEGFEEIEAVTVVDLLRRAGVEVVTAALGTNPVKGSRGVPVVADVLLDDVSGRTFEAIVLPGGMPGAAHLREDGRVRRLLQRQAGEGRLVAAICAAPTVLAEAGLLEGRRATSFPGFLDADTVPGLQIVEQPVVADGNVLTSRGPGTAMDFALELIERLEGPAVRAEVESRLQRPDGIGRYAT